MPRERFNEKRYKGGAAALLFPYSIGRTEYFIRSIFYTLLTYLPLAFIAAAVEASGSALSAILYLFLLIGQLAGVIWIAVIPRMRDMGWLARAAWLTLIPGFNIIIGVMLLFKPGKPIR
jgi:hypothetical protein